MKDRIGRTIDYMRLSVTDRCNLRCRYCMPDGCDWLPMEQILTLEEIAAVCRMGAELGIRKVKLTGGEPLVRRGLTALAQQLHAIPGLEQITLTTNGVLLAQYAQELQRAGVSAVNVSLDTLRPDRFAAITGQDALSAVRSGIDKALELGLRTKVNVVLQKDVNEDEWPELAALAKDRPLDVRFIELMPIGHGRGQAPISNRALLKQMGERFGEPVVDERVHGNGPAVYYRLPGFTGSVGLISAIHGKFCADCNRVRLTSTGYLKGCLCYADGADLREPLRAGDLEETRRRMEAVIYNKPDGHCFDRADAITEVHEMSKIGG